MTATAASPKRFEMGLYFLMLVMLITGACNVLLKDFMVNVQAPIGPNGHMDDFHRPILWSLLMKSGMALCLLFHFQWPKAPLYVFMISCTLGFVTDVFVNMAYFGIAGSAIQMLRGGKVVLTALLSVAFLGKRLRVYQIFGATAVVFGIALVGMSTSMRLGGAPAAAAVPWKAIGFCVAGELTQSVLWVYQESVLKTYDIAPLQLVGIEGSMGIVVGSIAVGLAHHPFGIENVHEAVHQLSHSLPLMICVASLLVSMALFNFSGVGVTKKGGAVHRSIIDVSRSVVIWMVELSVSWHVFTRTQFVGFAVLAFGALVYNHIIVVPALDQVDAEETIPVMQKKLNV